MKFNKEATHILIASLVLAFIFGFNDKQPNFIFSYWIRNLFMMFLFALITILIHNLAHKIVARKFGGTTKFRISGIRRYGFARDAKFPIIWDFLRLKVIPITRFYLAPLIAVLVTLFSKGILYFPLIESFEIEQKKYKRVGRKWPNIIGYEHSLIALAGPVSSIVFALVLNTLNSGLFSQFITMNILYGLVHMIPISSFDGCKILFGTRYLYLFTILAMVIIALVIGTLNAFQSIFLAIVLSLITTWIVFFWTWKDG